MSTLNATIGVMATLIAIYLLTRPSVAEAIKAMASGTSMIVGSLQGN